MTGKKSRNKGATFEREIRNYLKDRLNREIPNPAASGFSGADAVVGRFACEIKNHAKMAMPQWWAQAIEQCKDDELPVVIHKRVGAAEPGAQWVTMSLATFAAIVELIDGPTRGEPGT